MDDILLIIVLILGTLVNAIDVILFRCIEIKNKMKDRGVKK